MTKEDIISEIRVWTMGFGGLVLTFTALTVPFSIIQGQNWSWIFLGITLAIALTLAISYIWGGAKASKAALDERVQFIENRSIVVSWYALMWLLPLLTLASQMTDLTMKQVCIMSTLLFAGLPWVLNFLFELKAGR